MAGIAHGSLPRRIGPTAILIRIHRFVRRSDQVVNSSRHFRCWIMVGESQD